MRFDIIEFDRSYGTSSQLKRFSEPEIVFSGRSNVGKSSLINKLLTARILPASALYRERLLPSTFLRATR